MLPHGPFSRTVEGVEYFYFNDRKGKLLPQPAPETPPAPPPAPPAAEKPAPVAKPTLSPPSMQTLGELRTWATEGKGIGANNPRRQTAVFALLDELDKIFPRP
jgi:hypothetical protein